MDYLMQLGVFGGKVALLVGGIGLLMVLLAILIARARQSKPLLTIENLNQRFDDMATALKANIWDDKSLKAELKETKKKAKAEKKHPKDKPRIYVVDFNGDLRATHVEHLREEISSILTVARPGQDEVLIRLESPGGMAHTYGLAAAQLLRVKNAGVKLTVAVDKVAASGGYMMACTADRILAAPFAIVGSIGVVAQVPNFHRLLKKHDVDFEEMTAGEFKRTVSLFGEITEKGRRKFLDQLEDFHQLFKGFVKTCRPTLDLERVSTGEYWHGRQALELGLIDEILSSDEYIFTKRLEADLYKIEMQTKKKWSEKLAENMSDAVAKSLERIWLRGEESRWF